MRRQRLLQTMDSTSGKRSTVEANSHRNSKETTMIRNTLIALFLSLVLAQSGLAEDISVDLNTATAEQLVEVLNGIGPSKAEAIIAYRDANGGFQHIDELVNVKGIGLRTVDRNRSRMEVSEPPAGN